MSREEPSAEWAERWQQSWDRLEERYVPDREALFAFLAALVVALQGPAPAVIDLACGPGSLSRLLLRSCPTATSVAVDVDPVLLRIASATFAEDRRVQVVSADLADRGWTATLPPGQVDAVVTTTALHWLSEDVVRRLYRDLAGLLSTEGIFLHAEVMPVAGAPRLTSGLARMTKTNDSSTDSVSREWDRWWTEAGADPALKEAVTRRKEVFGFSYPTVEFSPPADWHITALHQAGFNEAEVIWRNGAMAVVAAIL